MNLSLMKDCELSPSIFLPDSVQVGQKQGLSGRNERKKLIFFLSQKSGIWSQFGAVQRLQLSLASFWNCFGVS